MTQDEMVLKVSRLYEEKWGLSDTWLARAAIALVLEEAARVVESTPFQFKITGAPPGSIEVVDTSKTIAAAIRALKGKP